jgi:hypothetical protein
MRSIVAWILGIGLFANGLIMLTVPAVWYAWVPGISEASPFNPHFIRDIGAAYLVAGTALPSFALYEAARPAAGAGAAFLALHGIVHLSDAVAGREHTHALLMDAPSVFLPAILAFWIAWPLVRCANSSEE